MKQVCNEFDEMYYLTETGYIYNSKTNKYMNPNVDHCFRLKTKDGKYKKISQKSIYKLVFNQNYCIDNTISLNNEEWKPISNTNNVYWVSNKGRIKSLKCYEAKILKPYYNKQGYLRVDIIYDNGIRCSKFVSRLVAAAFLLPPVDIDSQLHHKDGNKDNNNADNLVWLTPEEHRAEHKKMKEAAEQEQKGANNINGEYNKSSESENNNSIKRDM